jgi:hypothetical protein
MGVFDVFQIPYSALQLEHETAIGEAAKSGAGIVIRGGVARGEPGSGHGSSEVWKQWEEAKMGEENVAAVMKGPLPASLYAEAKHRLAMARAARAQAAARRGLPWRGSHPVPRRRSMPISTGWRVEICLASANLR